MQPVATGLSENTAAAPGVDRLLIVRLGSMGDIIHTLPAVTALRQAFPEAFMGWVVEERWAELLCALPGPLSGPRSPQRPLVETIHLVNTKQWRASLFNNQTWKRIAWELSQVRSMGYDTAVDFQGAARSALIGRWSGARVIYGFAQPRENVASMSYSLNLETTGFIRSVHNPFRAPCSMSYSCAIR
jgi:heptosyltransferase-1